MIKTLHIGHSTHPQHATGLSVFWWPGPATTSFHLCGSAPATHECAVIAPDNAVNQSHGLLFTGCSVFGLSSVQGMLQWLVEQKVGLKIKQNTIPIVPAAAIYDLTSAQQQTALTADMAYQACKNAIENNTQQGQIGAGRGATTGKLYAQPPSPGGIGIAHCQDENIIVSAYAVVNAAGYINPNNHQLANPFTQISHNHSQFKKDAIHSPLTGINSTLVALFTNAKADKPTLSRIAKCAASGMARAIQPVFTSVDGDIIFATSLGEHHGNPLQLEIMAAEATYQAIINLISS
jgi:L-aminopeptidase/D-esterase-like protein